MALVGIYLCFILSGLAALIYQVAWTRQFALVFGTTELAIATVLAANMAGLAFGAALIGRRLPSIAHPLRWYATLELAIGVAAVAWVPICLRLAEQLMVALFGHQTALPAAAGGLQAGFNVGAAFIALGVPAALMGATLPLLVRHAVHTDAQVGRRVGALYAANTAGAVGGALLATISLLPMLGLRRTLWAAATLNLVIAAVAVQLARSAAPVAVAAAASAATGAFNATPMWRGAARVLPLMFFAGCLSFAHEVLWTRLLSHVFGSSLYAFGVMLACFLSGIVIGGAGAAFTARSQSAATRGLVLALLGTAVAAVWGWYVVLHWLPWSVSISARLAYGALVLMPLTIASGFTYPCAVRVLANSVADAGSASARVYAWNTVGAIVGALLTAFLLLPLLRYEGALHSMIIAALLLAAMAAWSLPAMPWRFAAPVSVTALVVGLMFHPAIPEALLRQSPINVSGGGELLHYSVGRSADVVVLRQQGDLILRSNGLPEASIRVAGRSVLFPAEAWMAPLAALARPAARDMLIVGLGSGRLIEAVPPSIRTIDVVELEPQVLAANRAISTLRSRNPLTDPRLNIVINDARAALAASSRRYDLILSQPSHPWTAGASHLYTREFMQQALAHLREGGVFVQWMNAGYVNEDLLRSLLATLCDVFANVRAYRTSPQTLLFLASSGAVDLETVATRLDASIAAAANHFAALGIQSSEDLLAVLALENDAVHTLAAGARVLTDDDNRLATTPVVDRGTGLTGVQLSALLSAHDPLLRRSSPIASDYLARRLLVHAHDTTLQIEARTRVRLLAAQLADGPEATYLLSIAAGDENDRAGADQLLQAGLARWPGSELLRYASLDSSWGALAFGKASPEATRSAALLTGHAASVLNATRAEATGEWQQLRVLDAKLAAVPATDSAFAQAALLRGDWRARVSAKDTDRQRLTDEAVQLLDAALLIAPSTRLYADRIWNLAAAERNAELIEAIDDFANGIVNAARSLAPAERQRVRNDLQVMERLMQSLVTSQSAAVLRTQSALQSLARATGNLDGK